MHNTTIVKKTKNTFINSFTFLFTCHAFFDFGDVGNFHYDDGALVSGSGAGRSSVVRAFAHGATGRRIDPSWGGPIELFLVPASAPRLV